MSSDPLPAGRVAAQTLVDDRYRVITRLGSGGMADVYCAEDQQLGRRVALKVLHRHFAEDQDFVERFRREASAAAGLQHPNVVQVFDRGEWDGTYYIAMEYLSGRSLKEIVREDGPLPPATAVDIGVQILRAARFAHKRGVIHRDIKPHNVILDGEGRVKVTDFGIARAGASDMTETGAIMGTAAYLSPEQAQGHAVGAASDLYSVGIVLYEMLTGRVPFEAESAVTIALKQVSEDPVPPRALNPEISPELEDVVVRALQKDPAQRFADADEFITALEAARDLPARPEDAGRDAATGVYPALAAYQDAYPLEPYDPEEPRRSRRFWIALAVALLALAALAAAAFLLLRPDERVVPTVVGLPSDIAASRLNERGFEVQIEQVRSTIVPETRVVRQRPDPGEKLPEGATVAIFVSTGPGSAEIPDVGGRPLAEARRVLERRGFEVAVERTFSETVPRGRVVETSPPARTSLNLGSSVTVIVSRGRETVAVPNVVGRSRDEARLALEGADLRVAVRREESGADPGTVLRQDPAAGARIPKGDVVTIVVARAPQLVRVPDVTGDTADEARDELASAGFEIVTRRVLVSDPNDHDRVTDQRPDAGERRKRGSRVIIFVGEFDDSQIDPDPGAPDPTPTASPTPSPTP